MSVGERISDYLRDWARGEFSWSGAHCIGFITGWADACDPHHGIAFERWRTEHLDYDEIETQADAHKFMLSIGIKCHADLAAMLAKHVALKEVSGGVAKPGFIVVRTGYQAGIIDRDYRPVFLNEKTGLAHQDMYCPDDCLLRPRGI